MDFKKLSLLLVATFFVCLPIAQADEVSQDTASEALAAATCEGRVLTGFDAEWLTAFPKKLQAVARRLEKKTSARQTNPYYLQIKNDISVSVGAWQLQSFLIESDLRVTGAIARYGTTILLYVYSVRAKNEEATKILREPIYFKEGEMPPASLRRAKELIELFEGLFLAVDDQIQNDRSIQTVTLKTAEIYNLERVVPMLTELGFSEVPEEHKGTVHYRVKIQKGEPLKPQE